AFQSLIVFVGVASPALGPAVQMCKFDAENRGLNSIEAAVDPFEIMVVLLRTTMVGEHACARRQLFVVGHQSAGVAVGAKVLPRVETETGNIGKLRDWSSLVVRAVRLGGVTDDLEAMLSREGQDRIHVRRL